MGGKATLQAESLTAPELSERPQLAVRRANKFLREQPESGFRVADHPGVDRFGQHYGVTGDPSGISGDRRYLANTQGAQTARREWRGAEFFTQIACRSHSYDDLDITAKRRFNRVLLSHRGRILGSQASSWAPPAQIASRLWACSQLNRRRGSTTGWEKSCALGITAAAPNRPPKRLRYPHGPGTSGPERGKDHDDIHPCPQPWTGWRSQPRRRTRRASWRVLCRSV